jgi:hypothetical protein
VDEIKLDGNELIVRGSHRRLADAIGFMEKRKLGEVPSFVDDWRARRDSNPRPLASEANTLSTELRARGRQYIAGRATAACPGLNG